MGKCSVANSECEAPEAYGVEGGGMFTATGESTRSRCYECGESVCKSATCSRVETWRGRRRRRCATCLEHEGVDLENVA